MSEIQAKVIPGVLNIMKYYKYKSANSYPLIPVCAYLGFISTFFIITIYGFFLFSAGSSYASSSVHASLPKIEEKRDIFIYADSKENATQQDKIIKGAKNFIDSVTARGLRFLADESITLDERKAAFKDLLTDSFDIGTIARFSMGRYWRKATPDQREEYLELFKKMIIHIYSGRFDEYSGQKIKIISARPAGEKDVIVTTQIISPDSSNISVRWRVRYDNNQYQIIDVIIEGVSMLVTQRSDFASVIQRGGGEVSVLLEHMREKVSKSDASEKREVSPLENIKRGPSDSISAQSEKKKESDNVPDKK